VGVIMATADFPNYTDTSSHDDPEPGVLPWRDEQGVWHFGGTGATHGGGNRGAGVPTGGSPTPTTPPPTAVPPTTGPGGINWGDFLTTMTGGLLNGLGQIFGQQRRQSYAGTAADPVQALSGVQRRLEALAPTVSQRATSTPSLTAPDVSAVRRAAALPNPAADDLTHLRNSLRAMGVDL